MKRQNPIKYLKLLGVLCLGLASLPVRAGDTTFSFDTDPSIAYPSMLVVGNHKSDTQPDGITPAWWYQTGGNPASGGYLSIADGPVGGKNLCVVFPDIDQGYPVKAFKLTMDLRVGNGTTEHGADGFSISYCREGDVILVNATNAVNNHTDTNAISGAAGGDSAAQTTDPAGSGDLENGTKSGVAILFDTWQGNQLPDTSTDGLGNPGPDTEGIEVRADDKTLKQIDMSADRNGNCSQAIQPDVTVCQAAACADANTMQTGPWANDGGLPDILCWQPLIVELDTNKQVTVTWKGVVKLDHFQLANYAPHRGRLVLMGRTGANNQNIHADNIHLVTTPAVEATFGTLSSVGLNGFKFTIDDNTPSTVTNVPLVKLDGVDVTSKVTVTKVGTQTTVSYTQTTNFVSASKHTVDATWQTSLGQSLSQNGQTFTVLPWTALPESYAVTGVDTTQPGFIIQPYQTTGGQPNRMYWTDEQLLGLHGTNVIDLSGVAGVTNVNYVAWNDVIDFSNDGTPGANGQFFHDLDWVALGIPGGGLVNDDNSSLAAMAYAYFPVAGTYVFGGNSDDGIRLTFGIGSESLVGIEVPGMTGGEGGRGISPNQNSGGVIVTKPGYYGFRYLFENGGGGCNLEFYTVSTPAGSTPLLINDSTNAASLKVYMVSTAAPPYVSEADPVMNNPGVFAGWTLKWTITDSGTTLDPAKVTLKVNGVAQSPTATKSGNKTSVTQPAPANYWTVGLNTVELTYTDSANATNTVSYSYTVSPYQTLPTDGVSAVGSGSNPGFRYKAAQIADPATEMINGWRNMAEYAVQVGGGFYPDNVADTTILTNSGNMWLSGANAVINFSQTSAGLLSDNGDFRQPSFPDTTAPGLPGPGMTVMDNDAFLVKTYLEFATPGLYLMGVNSDDSFRVGCADDNSPSSILRIEAPAALKGDVNAMATINGVETGAFGGALPVTPLTAQAVLCDPPWPTGVPNNAAELNGKIAILKRDPTGNVASHGFQAVQAGAIAVVVVDQDDVGPTRQPGIWGGSIGGFNVPVLTMDYSVGTNLIAQATTNASSPVTLTISQGVGVTLGDVQGGKGSSDVIFGVKVPQAGVYPFRLAWENGGGDANCEWFTQDPITGAKTLINAPGSPAKAYITRTAAPARPTMSIGTTGGVTKITYTGTLQSSATAGGGYADVPGATSPYTVTTSTGSQFYRARN